MQRTKKNRKKRILKQDSKSRKEGQNVVVVANPPGSSLLRCRTAIATLSHRYRYAVAPMSYCCRTDIATLSLRCCSTVAPLSHCYCSAVTPPLSIRCRAAVALLSHQYCSTVAPLLSLLLLLRSCTAIAPLLLHCRSTDAAVATQSHRYCTAIAPLSL